MPTSLLSGARAGVATDRSQVPTRTSSTAWLRLLVVPIAVCLTQATWWWEALTRWGERSPLGVVALVPVLALVVGWWTLRRDPRGPQIHDRQLDLILCLLFTVVAVALLVLEGDGRSLEAAAASSLTAAAIVVAGWGSRTLWQVRWPILLLLLTWVEPWARLNDLLSPLTARLAVEAGQIASLVLVTQATPAGGWQLAYPSGSGGVLDPTAAGGVLLMVFVGLSCGIAWACCSRGATAALGRICVGVGLGVLVAGAEWLVCVLWAGTGSQAPVDAWASGSVHLLTVFLLAVLVVAAATARQLVGRRESSRRAWQGSIRRAVGRLAAAVPQAGRATYAVCLVTAVLALLTARAAAPSVYDAMSRTITEAVRVLWP